MKNFTRYQRSTIIAAVLFVGIFLLSTCVERQSVDTENNPAVSFESFVGSQKCASCHQEVFNDHIRTAHFLTSQPATEKYVKGSFEDGKNIYAFNRSVAVAMEQRAGGYYQVEYFRGEEKVSKKMDIVVGSGTMGQSSMYWRDNYLFQLPITYFTAADRWSNSPGFPDKVVFNRVITSRCLECHATYASVISAPGVEPEQFDHNKIIYGVDCEKCHGPGAEHAAFHEKKPSDTVAKYILNPASFTRQQKLDLCALCHGGRLQKTQPSFSFTAGDELKKHFLLDTTAPDPDRIDVHGNQYGLMSASKCFKGSTVMTCNSCHDPHKNERGKIEAYSQKCMSCHQPGHKNFCPMEKQIGKSIISNCIDCHMPLKPSRAIAVFLPGESSPTAAQIRSHLIAVYPEISERLKDSIKK